MERTDALLAALTQLTEPQKLISIANARKAAEVNALVEHLLQDPSCAEHFKNALMVTLSATPTLHARVLILAAMDRLLSQSVAAKQPATPDYRQVQALGFLSRVRKLVEFWQGKKYFKAAPVLNALKHLDGVEKRRQQDDSVAADDAKQQHQQQQQQQPQRGRKRVRGRHDMTSVEQEYADMLEQTRALQKRSRLASSLRASEEDPRVEFEEHWALYAVEAPDYSKDEPAWRALWDRSVNRWRPADFGGLDLDAAAAGSDSDSDSEMEYTFPGEGSPAASPLSPDDVSMAAARDPTLSIDPAMPVNAVAPLSQLQHIQAQAQAQPQLQAQHYASIPGAVAMSAVSTGPGATLTSSLHGAGHLHGYPGSGPPGVPAAAPLLQAPLLGAGPPPYAGAMHFASPQPGQAPAAASHLGHPPPAFMNGHMHPYPHPHPHLHPGQMLPSGALFPYGFYQPPLGPAPVPFGFPPGPAPGSLPLPASAFFNSPPPVAGLVPPQAHGPPGNPPHAHAHAHAHAHGQAHAPPHGFGPRPGPGPEHPPSGPPTPKLAPAPGPAMPAPRPPCVFVWDLDETLIVFSSLLAADRRAKYGWEPVTSEKLGAAMRTFIFDLADDTMFFRALEAVDREQMTLDDAKRGDDGADISRYDFKRDGLSLPPCDEPLPALGEQQRKQIAYRYRHVDSVYRTYGMQAGGMTSLLPPETLQKLEQVLQQTDTFTGNWLMAASQAVLASVQAGHVNVLVSTGQLIPTMAKLMLYGLSQFFPADCVYSSAKVRKLDCFHRIIQRYGPHNHYCVIGDGEEEKQASAQLAQAHAAAGQGHAPAYGQSAPSTFFSVQRVDDLRELSNRIRTGTFVNNANAPPAPVAGLAVSVPPLGRG